MSNFKDLGQGPKYVLMSAFLALVFSSSLFFSLENSSGCVVVKCLLRGVVGEAVFLLLSWRREYYLPHREHFAFPSSSIVKKFQQGAVLVFPITVKSIALLWY